MRENVMKEAAPTVIRTGVWEGIESGMWAWLIQRITAVLLLVLVPLKIFSGYVIVGQLGGSKAWAANVHISRVVDTLLLFAVIFHALYGLRVILVDFGWVKQAKAYFKVFTSIGILLYLASLYFVVWAHGAR